MTGMFRRRGEQRGERAGGREREESERGKGKGRRQLFIVV
jgi:hypothetical protein